MTGLTAPRAGPAGAGVARHVIGDIKARDIKARKEDDGVSEVRSWNPVVSLRADYPTEGPIQSDIAALVDRFASRTAVMPVLGPPDAHDADW
jgi:hypothetical protein